MKKYEILTLLSESPLKTDRTILRPMNDEDIDEFLEHIAGALTLYGTELEELYREKCKEQICSDSGITFSIRLTESNEYIGYFELKELDIEPEIGIDLIESFQNQGFGYEVCQTAVHFIFEKTDIDTLKYNCFRNNNASLRLAEKLGAVRVSERVLLNNLQKAGLSQEIIDESVGFDIIVHEIRK